jgi:DNA polymerase III beta subunit
MQIATTREALFPALSFVIGAADSRNPHPILGSVLLTAKTGILSLLCSDTGVLAKARTTVDMKQDGAVAVDAHRLNSLIRTLPEKQAVELQNDGQGQLRVKAGRHRFRIPAHDAVDYPRMEVSGAGSLTVSISASRLVGMMGCVSYSMADSDTTRPYLNGAQFSFDQAGFWLVSTDGYRLSVDHEPIAGMENQSPRSVVVPRKTVTMAKKMLSQGGMVKLTVGKETVQFVFADGGILLGKAVSGQYPDWKTILPTFTETLNLAAMPFADALSMLAATNDPKAKPGDVPQVSIKAENRLIGLRRGDFGYCEVEASSSATKPFDADFNLDYLVDAVAAVRVSAEEIRIGYGEKSQAIRLSPQDKKYPFVLVMPRKN